MVFDSVTVKTLDTVWKFTPDTVLGYSVNLYTEKSAWKYEYNEYDKSTSLHFTTVYSHDYTFVFK